jgi:hypothetical protein
MPEVAKASAEATALFLAGKEVLFTEDEVAAAHKRWLKYNKKLANTPKPKAKRRR